MSHIKHVYFVRHAESDANINKTYSPPDTALSEKGLAQAGAVLSQCQKLPVEVIIASDYTRTVQTADILNKTLGKECITTPLFEEWHRPKEIVGKPKKDPEVLKVIAELRSRADDPDWHYSNEENFFEYRSRVERALDFVIKRPEEHVLVVTHSNTLRMILGTILHADQFTPQFFESMHEHLITINTGVSYARYYDDADIWRLVTWNNFSHLGEVA